MRATYKVMLWSKHVDLYNLPILAINTKSTSALGNGQVSSRFLSTLFLAGDCVDDHCAVEYESCTYKYGRADRLLLDLFKQTTTAFIRNSPLAFQSVL